MRHAMFKHVICKISECICFHFVDMLVKPLAYLHKTMFADIFCKKMQAIWSFHVGYIKRAAAVNPHPVVFNLKNGWETIKQFAIFFHPFNKNTINAGFLWCAKINRNELRH